MAEERKCNDTTCSGDCSSCSKAGSSEIVYPDEDRVVISARSIGDANVQMILEPLGGGGNTATAGAQLADTTIKEALDKLVASIDTYFEYQDV